MSESGGDPALIHRTIAGKFVVEKFLGGGAMGAVYRAHQVALDRKVAVKVMHRTLATDEAFVKRFKREAKAASKLDHPNSMRIIDYGEEPDGLLYIAMEHLEGRDLFRVIHEDWPLPNERIADVLMQALAAIAVAHDEGVIHRDLKPENIMVLRAKDDDGKHGDVVKVCDFGIAKITESDEPASTADPSSPAAKKLTTQGLVVGTPEYMSPEQARGEKLDPRSDLYAVGIILYQLLTGRTPFVAETPLAVVLKHLSDVPTPPHEIFAGVHKGLEAVCLKAIAKDREQRYQNAREMRAAIRTAVFGQSIPAPAMAHAPTEPLPIVAGTNPNASSPPAPSPMAASSKVTPLGTEAARAGRGKRRGVPAIAAVLVLGVAAGAGAMIYMKRSHAAKAAEPAHRITEKKGPDIAPPPSSVVKESPPDPTPSGSAETDPARANEHARMRDMHELASKRVEPAASASSPAPPAEPPPPSAPEPPPQAPPPQAQNAPPAAPGFDPRKCRVTLAKPQRGDRVRLASFEAAWNKCAHELTDKPPALVTPRLHYDEEGHVRVASCADCPPALKVCVERARGKLAPTGESGDFDVPLNVGCD